MEISSSGTSVLLSIGTSEEDWEAVVVEESAALTGTKLNLLLLKKSLAWKHEMDWGWTETSGDFVSWRGGRQWNRWPEEEDTVAPPGMVLHSNNIILVCLFVSDTAKGESEKHTVLVVASQPPNLRLRGIILYLSPYSIYLFV